MPNPFDQMQNAMMNVVTDTFGYDALWINPRTAEVLATARILFKSPTKHDDLQENVFDYDYMIAEYKEGDFTGLDVLAANPQNKATISIEGISYRVRKVIKKYDGKTLIAILAKPQIELEP